MTRYKTDLRTELADHVSATQKYSVSFQHLPTFPVGIGRLEVQVTLYHKNAFVRPINIVYAYRRATELEKADYLGVSGKIKFSKVHDDIDGPGYQNLLFVQWQKDCTRQVVWPKSVATGKVVLPPWVTAAK